MEWGEIKGWKKDGFVGGFGVDRAPARRESRAKLWPALAQIKPWLLSFPNFREVCDTLSMLHREVQSSFKALFRFPLNCPSLPPTVSKLFVNLLTPVLPNPSRLNDPRSAESPVERNPPGCD